MSKRMVLLMLVVIVALLAAPVFSSLNSSLQQTAFAESDDGEEPDEDTGGDDDEEDTDGDTSGDVPTEDDDEEDYCPEGSTPEECDEYYDDVFDSFVENCNLLNGNMVYFADNWVRGCQFGVTLIVECAFQNVLPSNLAEHGVNLCYNYVEENYDVDLGDIDDIDWSEIDAESLAALCSPVSPFQDLIPLEVCMSVNLNDIDIAVEDTGEGPGSKPISVVDPPSTVDTSQNACYQPDWHCVTDADWEYGWYVAQVELGNLLEIPERYTNGSVSDGSLIDGITHRPVGDDGSDSDDDIIPPSSRR